MATISHYYAPFYNDILKLISINQFLITNSKTNLIGVILVAF